MYTIYNTGDIVFRNSDGSVTSIWTNDGLYCNADGLRASNLITKAVVQVTRLAVIAIDKIRKA